MRQEGREHSVLVAFRMRYLRLRCICSCDGDLGAGELRSRL